MARMRYLHPRSRTSKTGRAVASISQANLLSARRRSPLLQWLISKKYLNRHLYARAMCQPSTVRPRRSTVGSFGGAGWVLKKFFAGLAAKASRPDQRIIDATHLKAHRTGASHFKKGALPRRIGFTKGGVKQTTGSGSYTPN